MKIKALFNILEATPSPNLLAAIMAAMAAAALELGALAGLVPLMALIAGDLTNPAIELYVNLFALRVDDEVTLILVTSSIAIGLMLASSLMNSLALYIINKFGFRFGHLLSISLYRRYINAPYKWLLRQNVSDLQRKIVPEVDRIATGVLVSSIMIMQKIFTAFLVIILMFMADAVLTSILLLFGGISYGLMFVLMRTKFIGFAKNVIAANESRMNLALEAFDGIKDLKINNLGEIFTSRYEGASYRFNENQSSYLVASAVVRYLIEGVGIAVMLSYVITAILIQKGNTSEILQDAAIIAMGSYRLLPAFQAVYQNIATFLHHFPAAKQIIADYEEIADDQPKMERELDASKIIISDVTHKYENNTSDTFSGLTLTFESGEITGIKGPSGSGKSTLVDLIAALLEPTTGTILVEDAMGERSHEAPSMAYVTQHSHIFSGTILENITLFLPNDLIDKDKLDKALRGAGIDKFFLKRLERGLSSNVGDRGGNLSGGQRQRIAIARALYSEPSVLILDEATSGLEQQSQADILTNLKSESRGKIVIIISHDPSVYDLCDKAFELQALSG